MFINKANLLKAMKSFGKEDPFDHCVVDGFFKKDVALNLEKEFPTFNSDIWHEYNNPLEVKKLCNNWNTFPRLTYQIFSYLNSDEFVKTLSEGVFGKKELFSDVGLNGGGWHIHKHGGKLNTHLDYSIHPKLDLQRKLNIIVYLNSKWKSSWGGNLGLWSNESDKKPGPLIKEVEPKFNRAILFDTTQNSWHGLPNPLKCPKNQYRKSLAVYYLCKPPLQVSTRGKALFSPMDSQKNDKKILDLIKKRSNIKTASSVYK